MTGAALLGPASPGRWLRRLASGVALAGIGRGLALAGMAVFAARLPLADWGVLSHARGVLTVLAPLVTLGLAVTAMRRIPQYAAEGRAAEAAGHAALGFAAALAAAPLALLLALLWPGAPAARWLLLALPAAGALFFGTQAARAQGRPALAYAPPGLAALGAAAGFVASRAEGVEPAALWLASGLALAAVAQAAGVLGAGPRPRLGPAWAWLAEAAPLNLSQLARGATLLGPFLLLPLWAGAEEAGVYGLAWLLAQAALVALAGVSGACGPRLSAALGRGDWPAARAAAGIGAGAGASAALLAGGAPALALALAPAEAEALRPGLAAAALPLAWLAGAAALQALDAPLGAALVARGRGRQELSAALLGAAVTLGAALPLIPAFGGAGAATAVVAGAAARLMRNLLRRPLSPPAPDRSPP
ncbi:MAG: polysaccharide biosynthesis C-terminal domain-containing protein [Pseudomonadota bacterium]